MTREIAIIEVVLWALIASAIALVRARTHARTVGLVLAYIANLWLIHWPAALVYLLPWYPGGDWDYTMNGFAQSFYAIVGLAIGILGIAPLVLAALRPPRSSSDAAQRRLPNEKLPYTYLVIGLLMYLVIGPLLSHVPTVSAIAHGTQQLTNVGICLLLWYGWFARKRRVFVAALVLACTLPLLSIIREGFLGYGAMALISVMTFTVIFARPRWMLAVLVLAVSYIGFSFYVTYMRDRGDIRASVWGGAPTSERIETLGASIHTIEWFDPHNPIHLLRINERLNQNYLVGAAVESLEQGTTSFAHGQTVLEAFQSLIPRAIWPDKPLQAGSGDIVTRYTGIPFAGGTSVGVGQVLEFYINFGSVGVVLGFMVFGVLLTLLDAWAAQRLWAGDWLQFAVWYLPGLALMQAGGSLVEVASSAGAAVIAVLFVNRYIVPLRYADPSSLTTVDDLSRMQ